MNERKSSLLSQSNDRIYSTMLSIEMAETTPFPDEILYNSTDIVVEEIPKETAVIPNSPFAKDLGELFTSFSNLTNKCAERQWQQPQHVYFQVANALFLIAFLSPHKSYGFLLARCALVFASILLLMWSYLIQCSLDAFIWSGLFLLVNFIYLSVLIYQLRPIRFEKEIDAVIIFLSINRFAIFKTHTMQLNCVFYVSVCL